MIPDEVLATIRTIYERQRSPVEIWKIYKNIKDKSASVRTQLKILHSQGKIMIDVGTLAVTPLLSDEEIAIISDKKVYVTEDKIRECIRSFFRFNSEYPSSSEIADKFIEMYGKPEQKDIERYIRKLVEDGRLKRTEDFKYYFDGITSSNLGLRNYV